MVSNSLHDSMPLEACFRLTSCPWHGGLFGRSAASPVDTAGTRVKTCSSSSLDADEDTERSPAVISGCRSSNRDSLRKEFCDGRTTAR